MVYDLNHFPSSNLNFKTFFFKFTQIFYYVSFYLGGRVHVMARVEIKGQFAELWSLLLPCGPLRSMEVPLPAEPSYLNVFY